MFKNNEKNILNFIKIGPIFVILFSVMITFIMIQNNNKNFEEEIQKIKYSAIEEKKIQIKREVQRVYDFIEYEQNLEIDKIKHNIKEQVLEAYEVAMSIYKEGVRENISIFEIKRLISEALRNIRFNKGRGY